MCYNKIKKASNKGDTIIKKMSRAEEIKMVLAQDIDINDKIAYFRDNYMNKRTRKYADNRTVDLDDIQQMWLIGLANGLKDVAEIGDPVEHILHSAKLKAWSFKRDTVAKFVTFKCPHCRYTHRADQYYRYCPKCGEEMDSIQYEQYGEEAEINLRNIPQEDKVEEITYEELVESLRDTLDLTGRKAELFDFLIAGEARDYYKNYSKTFAEQCGCSPQRVTKLLKDLQKLIIESGWLEAQGIR